MGTAAILQLLASLPQLIQAGIDVTAMATKARGLLNTMKAEGREPTAAEWSDLNATIGALRAELHAP